MHAVLLIRCADRPGIVAAVSTFLFRHGANVVDLDQHSTEEEPATYFMRLEFQTDGLDAGPIIDQDVARVSHRDSVDDLKALGRDLERRVLFRAVRWHCEDRILVHGNKTIVFA